MSITTTVTLMPCEGVLRRWIPDIEKCRPSDQFKGHLWQSHVFSFTLPNQARDVKSLVSSNGSEADGSRSHPISVTLPLMTRQKGGSKNLEFGTRSAFKTRRLGQKSVRRVNLNKYTITMGSAICRIVSRTVQDYFLNWLQDVWDRYKRALAFTAVLAQLLALVLLYTVPMTRDKFYNMHGKVVHQDIETLPDGYEESDDGRLKSSRVVTRITTYGFLTGVDNSYLYSVDYEDIWNVVVWIMFLNIVYSAVFSVYFWFNWQMASITELLPTSSQLLLSFLTYRHSTMNFKDYMQNTDLMRLSEKGCALVAIAMFCLSLNLQVVRWLLGQLTRWELVMALLYESLRLVFFVGCYNRGSWKLILLCEAFSGLITSLVFLLEHFAVYWVQFLSSLLLSMVICLNFIALAVVTTFGSFDGFQILYLFIIFAKRILQTADLLYDLQLNLFPQANVPGGPIPVPPGAGAAINAPVAAPAAAPAAAPQPGVVAAPRR